MNRLALAILSVVSVSSLAVAAVKPDVASWANLKQLARGQQVEVVLNNAESYRGQFASSTDNTLVLRLAGGEQTFARQDVLRVSTKGRSHRGRNALIGLGVGVGAGFALAAATARNDSEAHAIGLAVIPPVAGAAGAVGGALVHTGGWHDVYRAR
jgi:hypothetical protein